MVTRIQSPIVVEGEQDKSKLGLVHIITGDGKGKTTSALGLALRAIGNGYKVYMIQFLKSGGTGELYAAKSLPNFTIVQYGVDAIKERHAKQSTLSDLAPADKTGRFIFQPDIEEKDAAKEGFELAKKVILSGEYEVVILDEINCVLDKGLISTAEIIDIIKKKGNTELLLTGRDAPTELYEYADYVSIVSRVKHPWDQRIKARKGIEY